MPTRAWLQQSVCACSLQQLYNRNKDVYNQVQKLYSSL